MESSTIDFNQYNELYSFETFDIYKDKVNETHYLYLFHSNIDASSNIYQKEYTMINHLKDLYPVIKILKNIYTKDRFGFLFVSENFSVMMKPIRDQNNIKNCAQTLAEMHVKLHNINNTLEVENTHEKIERLIKSITTLDTYKENLIELYTGIDQKSCLCHFDFGPYHMLISDSEVQVISWTNAGYGNPMGDVAKTVFWLCSDYVPGFGPYLIGSGAKRAFVNDYIKRYSQLAPFDYDAFIKWLVIFSAIEYDSEIKDEGISDELILLEKFIADYFDGKKINFFDYIIWNDTSHKIYK